MRICLNASVLEGLTVISDISRKLYENGTQKDDDVTEVDTDNIETSCSPSSYQSQLQNEVICSSFEATTMDPKAEMESRNSTLEAPDSTAVEEGHGHVKKMPWPGKKMMMSWGEVFSKKIDNQDVLSWLKVTQKGSDVVIDVKEEGTRHVAKSDKSHNSPTRIAVTFSSFEQPPFNAEAALQTRNLSESFLHDERSREADDENALEGHLLERDKHSRSSLIAGLKDPPTEEMTHKSNSLGDENSSSCDKKSDKQDSVEDPRYHDTRNVESSLLPSESGQITHDDNEQSIIETSAENVLPKVEVEDATLLNLHQSEKPSFIHDQTQGQQESNLQEVRGPRTYTAAQVEMDKGSYQVEEVKDHNMQESNGREVTESSKAQHKPLG
ncbi:hypothetical protein ACROYT_G025063 [Oculina patagonica]